jgi:hypothetical protein
MTNRGSMTNYLAKDRQRDRPHLLSMVVGPIHHALILGLQACNVGRRDGRRASPLSEIISFIAYITTRYLRVMVRFPAARHRG